MTDESFKAVLWVLIAFTLGYVVSGYVLWILRR